MKMIFGKSKSSFKRKEAITGFLFVLPWVIGFFWFFASELFMAVKFAFNEMTLVEGGYTLRFVGLDNFKYALLQDASYNKVLVDSLKDILIRVPLIIFFSLFMAILLNGKFKGRTIARAVLFLPIIMNAGAVRDTLAVALETATGGVAATAGMMETASSAGVNIQYYIGLLTTVGVPKVLIEYIISAVSEIYTIVQMSSVQIIIFIAALQTISKEHYEVAKIFGATPYETFWKVTFPMVSPLILTNIVYTIVDSFVDSEVVEMAYDMAFAYFNWGVSVAMSLISSIIVCAILLFVGVVVSRKTFYYN